MDNFINICQEEFFFYNGIAEADGMVGTCTDKAIQPLYSKQVN